jgi:hypothetical protein
MCDAGGVVLRRWIIGLLGLATLACYTNRYPLVAVALAVPANPAPPSCSPRLARSGLF